jgi:acetyl esterase
VTNDSQLDLDIASWLAKNDVTQPELADAVAEARRRSRERNAEALARMNPALIPASEADATIAGPAGELAIRVLRPADTGPKATVVYFHGGGWMVGDIDTHLGHARRMSTQINAVVVMVNYRRAPEDRFPAAFDDAVAATEWAAAHLDELGSNGMLVVAGDSVGGQLAASVAIARRNAGQPLTAQLLLYPVTDVLGRYGDRPETDYFSRRTVGSGYGLTLADMNAFACNYVDEADSADWRVSPLRCDDLTGVAPAVVHTATLDVLRTEGNFYAQALEKAGVRVISREFPTLNHSYFGLGGVSGVADSAAAQAAEDLISLLD